MSTIVQHYDKKTGKIRVYESTPHYDPVTKQSRPKPLDPETGELIPSSGRRGRRPSPKNATTTEENAIPSQITELQKSVFLKENEIASLQAEVKKLKATIRSYEKICASIASSLGKAPREI